VDGRVVSGVGLPVPVVLLLLLVRLTLTLMLTLVVVVVVALELRSLSFGFRTGREATRVNKLLAAEGRRERIAREREGRKKEKRDRYRAIPISGVASVGHGGSRKISSISTGCGVAPENPTGP